ncbi:MAG: SIS domain-containing protein [Rhodomicrobium sp.]
MATETRDWSALWRSGLDAHIAVAYASADVLAGPFAALVALAISTLERGNKLLFFGNGGSASDAQHWAAELTVRYRLNRRALAAIALTADSSALTAAGNDFGFEHVFSRQVEALALQDDLAVGISTSGRSPNVILGLEQARTMGCKTALFTGNGGAALARLADIALIVPSAETARIQELHGILGHALCYAIESHFTGAPHGE